MLQAPPGTGRAAGTCEAGFDLAAGIDAGLHIAWPVVTIVDSFFFEMHRHVSCDSKRAAINFVIVHLIVSLMLLSWWTSFLPG